MNEASVFEKELQKFWDINRDIISTNFNFEFPKDSVAKNLKSSYSLLLHNLPGEGLANFFKKDKFARVHIDPVTIIVGTTGAGRLGPYLNIFAPIMVSIS